MGLFDGFRRARPDKNSQQEGAKEPVSPDPVEPSEPSASVDVQSSTASSQEEQADAPLASDNVDIADTPSADDPETAVDTAPASPVKHTPIRTFADKEPITHEVGATRIYSIINQKGGVGKSTTAIDLAAALGEEGKAVLVVDLDPQGNATSGLGIDRTEIRHDVYEVLLGNLPAAEAIIPDVCKGMDVLPSTINLAGAEVELVSEMARENRLKSALSELRGVYDYILIDCPPALGLLTVNALVACDKLIIPIQCEYFALEGVTKLLDSMKRVKNALNADLDIFGVLLTMYDSRTMLSKQVANEVRGFFGEAVFETVIPRSVRLAEAPSFGQPITEYDPTGRGAQAYCSLAKEVIERG